MQRGQALYPMGTAILLHRVRGSRTRLTGQRPSKGSTGDWSREGSARDASFEESKRLPRPPSTSQGQWGPHDSLMPDFISRPTRESVLMISLPVVACCYGDHKGPVQLLPWRLRLFCLWAELCLLMAHSLEVLMLI